MSVYEAHKMDPKIPFIFHNTVRSSPHPYAEENWHENIEIFYMAEGEGTVIGGDEPIRMKKGDIAVINTNRIHAMTNEAPVNFYCIIVDRHFCLSNHFDTSEITFETLFNDGKIASLIEELKCEYCREDEKNSYRVQSVRAILLRIMSLICRDHTSAEEAPPVESRLLSSIKQAVGFIHSESHRDISLDEISAEVGFSKFYFSREFKRITGYTFISYLNLVRCKRAKHLLVETQLSIGEISRLCGFENQSYFSRAFLRITGVLPSEYREMKNKNKG